MSKTLHDPDEAMLRQFGEMQRRLEAIERRPRKVAVVRRISSYAITGGASGWQTVPFEMVTIDTDEIFDFASPTKLTCKTAGIYLAVTNLTFTSGVTSKMWFGIRFNGQDFASALGPIDELPASDKTGLAVAIVSMTVGDYIEAMAKQDDGGSQNLTPTTGPVNLSMVMTA